MMARRAGIGLIAFVAFAGALLADPPRVAPPGQPGAYIDERHLTALAFGTHSHWLQPWRAYQETLPAQRFLDAQGVVLELPDAEAPDLIVAMLARHGVRNARIEIGWGFVNYWNESKLNHAERLKALLLACEGHGVRPLILLNANSGVPVPTERLRASSVARGEERRPAGRARGRQRPQGRLQRARQPQRILGRRSPDHGHRRQGGPALEAAPEGPGQGGREGRRHDPQVSAVLGTRDRGLPEHGRGLEAVRRHGRRFRRRDARDATRRRPGLRPGDLE